MISIRVNEEILDSFEGETLAITYAANEIGKLETRQGNSSNSYTLPYTTHNAELLGFPDNINLVNGAPYSRIEAELLKDGLLIDKGVLQIVDVQEKTVQVTFYGGNSDWFAQIKDLKLSDIDLSALDHVWSEANIVNSWPHTWDDGYIYPLIDYGRRFTIAQTEVEDWYPAVFVRYLIKKGLEQKGFKIGGALLRENLFNKVIIPFCKEAFVSSGNALEETSGTIWRNTTQSMGNNVETKIDFNTIQSDDTGNWSTGTDRYTASEDSYVRFTFIWFLAPNREIRVKINGTLETTIDNSNDGEVAFSYFLNSGDYVEFFFFQNTGSSILTSIQPITATITNAIYEGDTIFMSNQMPDVKLSDLIKWVAFSFGVFFTYDRFTKTINFNLFKDINPSDSLDWSDKLVNINKIDFTDFISNYNAINRAKYLENEDDRLLNSYAAGTGNNFGDGTIDINNDFLKGEGDIYQSPFCGTVQRVGPFGGYLPFIQRFSVSEDENGDATEYFLADIDPKPRVLVLAGDISVSNFSIYSSTDVGSTTGETSCAYAYFFKNKYSANLDAFTESLAYSAPILGNPNDTPLFDNSYWRQYLTILGSPRFVEAEMLISEFDIKTFEFTKAVFVERLGAYFFVNKIKEYTGSGTTVVELIKL